jgi:response regulator RpfG family c-di-GMP phosphodiesterase
MDFEEAFKVVDSAVFTYTGKHLNDVQKIVLEGSWYGQTYDQIAEARGYSGRYLKQDVGHQLWGLLSKALGEEVKKTNFRTAIEYRAQLRFAWNLGKLKLMLVDDEPDNLDLLYRTFRRDFQVFRADGALHAIEILEREGEMAIIISDQRMPVMKGAEFLSLTLERFPDTTRILLTGYTDTEDLVEATNSAHVFKYVTKPWDPKNLKAVAQEAAQMYLARKQTSKEVAEAQSSQDFQEEEQQEEFATVSSKNSKKLKLMVVDDEPDNLDLLYRTFRRDFQVFKTDGAFSALKLLEQEGEMAIIISDQKMPLMKGTDFLGQIVERFPNTIRIILTGYTEVEDLFDAINYAQAFKYITKPWNPENLKAVVQEAAKNYLIQKKRSNDLHRLWLLKKVIFTDET